MITPEIQNIKTKFGLNIGEGKNKKKEIRINQKNVTVIKAVKINKTSQLSKKITKVKLKRIYSKVCQNGRYMPENMRGDKRSPRD